MRDLIKKLVRRAGFDVVRLRDPVTPPTIQLLSAMGIDLILDVGANVGQYAMRMRRGGYRGRIVSFEPLAETYRELVENAAGDAAWETVQLALGDEDTRTQIHVAGNSYSSSLLAMLPLHEEAAPSSTYVGMEEIEVRKLDSIIGDYHRPGERLFVKIDAQGYEKQVIDGGKRTQEKVVGMQIELSTVPLYEGQLRLPEMVDLMEGKGYLLAGLDPRTFNHPATGQLLQVDGVFYRADELRRCAGTAAP